MKYALVLVSLGLVALAAPPPPHQGTVVLELFTSQGCSSCPPADSLLAALGREDFGGRVIPLAYHVDYWNYLGWSDPFSSRAWTARQNDYAGAMKASQVYTPQLVLNGTAQMVGSAEHAVRAEIRRQLDRGDRGVVSIDRVARNGAALDVDLTARLDDPGSADVVVVLYENGTTTAVAHGENAGRKLANDHVVRWEQRAFAVKNAPQSGNIRIAVAPGWNAANLGVAAFLQDPRSRAIYAAAARAVR